MEWQDGDIIRIKKPYVEERTNCARLICEIVFKGEMRQVWFEVPLEYGQYLCNERSDAFLIALLPIAMREKCDMVCEAPVGEELLYQVRTFLVPALARASRRLYATRIIADIDTKVMTNAGAVGTGCSCGVDSLHAVVKHWKCQYPSMRLTHLAFYNVGAFDHVDNGEQQKNWQLAHARNFCKEYGFKLIETDSNISSAFPIGHLCVNTYRNCFAVFALQKFWRTYYIGSVGLDFQHFCISNSEFDDCAHYDLLTLDVLSTRNLKLYSDGGAIDRFTKTEALVDFEPAQKYLHVCLSDRGENCGRCMKCRRTLLTLDALDMLRGDGTLNAFSQVFDIQYYRIHRNMYIRWLLRQKYGPNGDRTVDAVYDVFMQKDKGSILRCLPGVLLSVILPWLRSGMKHIVMKSGKAEQLCRRILGVLRGSK